MSVGPSGVGNSVPSRPGSGGGRAASGVQAQRMASGPQAVGEMAAAGSTTGTLPGAQGAVHRGAARQRPLAAWQAAPSGQPPQGKGSVQRPAMQRRASGQAASEPQGEATQTAASQASPGVRQGALSEQRFVGRQ
jgi:hypothetical protein